MAFGLSHALQIGSGLLGFAGSERANKSNRSQADSNQQWQRENMQKQIQWRVADAKAAGINPLAALGLPSYGGVVSQPAQQNSLQHMGQGISRAASNIQSAPTKRLMAAQLRQAEASASLAETQAAAAIQQLNGQTNARPADPIPSHLPGQPDAAVQGIPYPGYRQQDVQLRRTDPNNPLKEAGSVNEFALMRTKDGYAVVPSFVLDVWYLNSDLLEVFNENL